MTKKSEIGQYGEDLACEYLTKQGYRLIEQNYRQSWGEIDIIVRAPDKTLVFVEVKAMTNNGKQNNALKPEDNLSRSKFLKVSKTAAMYAGHNPQLIDKNRGWRIDLVAIDIFPDKEPAVRHYENTSF